MLMGAYPLPRVAQTRRSRKGIDRTIGDGIGDEKVAWISGQPAVQMLKSNRDKAPIMADGLAFWLRVSTGKYLNSPNTYTGLGVRVCDAITTLHWINPGVCSAGTHP